jgi:hypothetical protein
LVFIWAAHLVCFEADGNAIAGDAVIAFAFRAHAGFRLTPIIGRTERSVIASRTIIWGPSGAVATRVTHLTGIVGVELSSAPALAA